MGDKLRFMSANLWSGAADPDGFAELLVQLQVDVVAVQEVRPAQAEAIAGVMPYGSLVAGDCEFGTGIGLKRPGEVIREPLPHRHARVTRLDPAAWPEISAPIDVYNVHLMAPHELWPRPSFVERPRQLRAVEALVRSGQSPHRVVMGDFNATPLWPAYRRMASQLTDAAVAVAEAAGTRTARTWGPWHGSPRLLRIDHGFVDGLAVEAFRVIEVPGSDHSAIVMDVASPAVPASERSE